MALLLIPVLGVAAAALPDGREYEMVSPVDKNGGDVLLLSSRSRAADDGSAFAFGSLVGFGAIEGMAISTDYLATRAQHGWRTHGITPQQDSLSGLMVFSGPGDAVYEGELAADLSRGVVRANAFPQGSPNVASVQNLFVRTDLLQPGPGDFSLLSDSVVPIPPPWTGFTPPPPKIIPVGYKPLFAGASNDFSHVIFESMLNLTQEAIDAGLPDSEQNSDVKLYEWTGGTLRLVGVLPEEEGGGLAQRAVAGRGAAGGGDGHTNPFYTSDAISDDGSRIFFTTPDSGQLYVRENASTTTRVNASERTVPASTPSAAQFRGASADGTRVFFMSAESLTDDDSGGMDLWRSDMTAPAGSRLTRLSPDDVPGDDHDPPVTGVLGVSDDGSWAYFIAEGALVGDMPAIGFTTPVIYAWHDGEVRYVAKLAVGERAVRTNGTDPRWLLAPQTSRVTPDGRHALFITTEPDQAFPQDHGLCEGRPCEEVYVFDAQATESEALTCISCTPGGTGTPAESSFLVDTGTGGAISTSHMVRPLSDDGRYAFFHTREALTADDRNDKFDAYSFDLEDGELSLLSSGRADAEHSYFLDAGASGEDVFFATRSRLVGWDVDGSYDVYDARVGGGFPEPPLQAPPCVGRACQDPSSRASTTANEPSSGRFRGSGNVTGRARKPARRCRRGKVRKRVRGRVRCVRRGARGGGRRARNA